ncbi:hypothetical protein [Bauldia sp.]|uniref:hypothetical protein n=1 Tax=Bauldia sp. TaxID=2575872 RepID=UPI003BA8D56D
MAYVAFATWTFPEGWDEDDRVIGYSTESLKELKAKGADRAVMVKTSATEAIFFEIYPDEAAYQRAADTLAKRREGGAAGTGGTMTGTMFGKAVIDL